MPNNVARRRAEKLSPKEVTHSPALGSRPEKLAISTGLPRISKLGSTRRSAMKRKPKNRGWGRIKFDRRKPKYFYQPPLDRLPKLRTLLLDIYEHAKEDYDDGNLYYIPNYRRLRRAGVTGITAKRYLRKACQER